MKAFAQSMGVCRSLLLTTSTHFGVGLPFLSGLDRSDLSRLEEIVKHRESDGIILVCSENVREVSGSLFMYKSHDQEGVCSGKYRTIRRVRPEGMYDAGNPSEVSNIPRVELSSRRGGEEGVL